MDKGIVWNEMEREYFRAWVEIDLDALLSNHRAVKKHLPAGTALCAVVKADAYGHGAVRVAKLLEKETEYFAVAMAEEAYELRRAGVTAPVLILGLVPEKQMRPLIEKNVTLTVATAEEGEAIIRAALAAGKRAKVHIALDTGMGRIGFQMTEQSLCEIENLAKCAELQVEGIFSHFACADEENLTSALRQKERFDGFVATLERRGVKIPLQHLFNSAAVCNLEGCYGMAREGLVLYGLSPSDYVNTGVLETLKPAMTMKSRIVQIKTVPAGTPVSYGSTYITDRETKIATVSVGYGDGVPRLLSGRGELLVAGKRAPIIGRICMDQMMLDVSAVKEAAVGGEVVLFGFDGKAYLDCGEQTEKCGSICYEFLCNVNRRVPRVYISGGKIESIVNILPEEE